MNDRDFEALNQRVRRMRRVKIGGDLVLGGFLFVAALASLLLGRIPFWLYAVAVFSGARLAAYGLFEWRHGREAEETLALHKQNGKRIRELSRRLAENLAATERQKGGGSTSAEG